MLQVKEVGGDLLSDVLMLSSAWYVDNAAPVDTDSKPDCPGYPFVPRGVNLRSGLACQAAWSSQLNSSLLAQHSSYSRLLSRDINQLEGAEYQFR